MSNRILTVKITPILATKKLQIWIKSHHLICQGHFFILETVEYSMIERFEEYISILGGSLICVESPKKVSMGNHRQVILYQAKASLHTPHQLKEYWQKYGAIRTKFDQRD
ncbi:MAG: CpeR family transcriptional regulator [Cyanobacteria bacterium]|nr:CpeR family transcriptional regulator [Cyanobacteria bacterium CG_2015-16_32_12]NCO77876.1 CpeR family transcriptional regulator [Cyanobacteria bacterium CG_2015-22_32_23]NCQ03061.1 CpeR family transcriptional regulator [Cyanobacteria bacterium CG_2015-09_32_10]NCQ41974.1 CpeR family transcriptional regulator [Cyanobacteria bacterium CG_2015-04_32_10]NCS84002.1 CpeR family transcriptional regulator [Cyanobacteria bacterium CG_2015-02_32_10]